jgi:hypothetical protein
VVGWRGKSRGARGSSANHLPGIVTTGISPRFTVPESDLVIWLVDGAGGDGQRVAEVTHPAERR